MSGARVAAQYDMFLSGDQQAGRELVARTLGEQGFTVTTNPNGGYTAKRGNSAATLLLGAMAGKNLQMTFFVEFFSGPDAQLIARVSRSVAAGALKGGMIGASKTNDAFGATVNAIAAAAHAAGIYVSAVEGQ